MLDAFLLVPSHRLSHTKSSNDHLSTSKGSVSSDEALYAIRYKEWWASQFSTIQKSDASRVRSVRVKEPPSRKRFQISSIFGIILAFSIGPLALFTFGTVPASSAWFEKYFFEVSTCKSEIHGLRNELKALNSSLSTKTELAGSNFTCENEPSNCISIERLCENKSEKSSLNPNAEDADSRLQKDGAQGWNQFGNSTELQIQTQDGPWKVNLHVMRDILKLQYIHHVGGRTNWLLHVNGATISDHSQSYCPDNIWFCGFFSRFGWYHQLPAQLSPEIILQKNVIPEALMDPDSTLGHCWAMNGTKGHINFRLAQSIEAEVLVLEHIPPQFSSGAGSSALKDFQVWGWSSDSAGGKTVPKSLLISAQFRLNMQESLVPNIQKFNVTKTNINHLQLVILSNHGNNLYTCLYKVKLYGKRA